MTFTSFTCLILLSYIMNLKADVNLFYNSLDVVVIEILS